MNNTSDQGYDTDELSDDEDYGNENENENDSENDSENESESNSDSDYDDEINKKENQDDDSQQFGEDGSIIKVRNFKYFK